MALLRSFRKISFKRLAIAFLFVTCVSAYCFTAVMALSITTIGIYLILLAIPLLLLVWASPDVEVNWDKFGFSLLLVFITSQIIIPNFYALPVSGLGWVNLRKIINITITIYIVAVFGLSKNKRKNLSVIIENNRSISFCVIGFFITILLSIPFSKSFTFSIGGLPQVITTWLAVTLLVLSLDVDASKALSIIRWTLINVIPLAFICLLERLLGRRVMFDVMPASVIAELMQNPAFKMLYTANSLRGGAFRAVASFSVPLSTGECGAMILPFGLFLLTCTRSYLDRGIGLVGLLSTCIILLTTNARGALLASCVVVSIFIAISLLEKQRSQPVSLIPSLFICFVPALLAMIASTDRFRKTVFGGGSTQSSNDGRIEQFNLALPHIAAHPLFGSGFAMSDEVVGFNSGSGTTIDSGLLTIVVDQGIPGLVLFFGMILLPVVRSLQQFLIKRQKSFEETILYFLGLSLLSFFINNIVLAQTENFGLLFLEIALYINLLRK